MRKIRFINVSSSSGQAMRARADNPIAIHHQAGRYTTIASLSLIIFFFFVPPSFFRVHVPKPRASRLFTVLRIQLCRHEWLPVDERWTGCYHLSSAIVADRHCQQNRDALLGFPRSRFVADENPTIPRHGVLKNHRAKNFRWRRHDLERRRTSRSLLLRPFIDFIISLYKDWINNNISYIV